jgi:hypothetical protein
MKFGRNKFSVSKKDIIQLSLLSTAFIIILISGKSEYDKKLGKINSRTTYVIATSKGFGGSGRNGKSIRFFYNYKGKRYDGEARIPYSAYNRCEENGYAMKYKYVQPFEFKIKIDSLNPEVGVIDDSSLCLTKREK